MNVLLIRLYHVVVPNSMAYFIHVVDNVGIVGLHLTTGGGKLINT